MVESGPLIAKQMAHIRSGREESGCRPEQRESTAAPWPEKEKARQSWRFPRFSAQIEK